MYTGVNVSSTIKAYMYVQKLFIAPCPCVFLLFEISHGIENIKATAATMKMTPTTVGFEMAEKNLALISGHSNANAIACIYMNTLPRS